MSYSEERAKESIDSCPRRRLLNDVVDLTFAYGAGLPTNKMSKYGGTSLGGIGERTGKLTKLQLEWDGEKHVNETRAGIGRLESNLLGFRGQARWDRNLGYNGAAGLTSVSGSS